MCHVRLDRTALVLKGALREAQQGRMAALEAQLTAEGEAEQASAEAAAANAALASTSAQLAACSARRADA